MVSIRCYGCEFAGRLMLPLIKGDTFVAIDVGLEKQSAAEGVAGRASGAQMSAATRYGAALEHPASGTQRSDSPSGRRNLSENPRFNAGTAAKLPEKKCLVSRGSLAA